VGAAAASNESEPSELHNLKRQDDAGLLGPPDFEFQPHSETPAAELQLSKQIKVKLRCAAAALTSALSVHGFFGMNTWRVTTYNYFELSANAEYSATSDSEFFRMLYQKLAEHAGSIFNIRPVDIGASMACFLTRYNAFIQKQNEATAAMPRESEAEQSPSTPEIARPRAQLPPESPIVVRNGREWNDVFDSETSTAYEPFDMSVYVSQQPLQQRESGPYTIGLLRGTA
jgi:hypothetical protein